MTVRPSFRLSPRMISIISAEFRESRFPVGSSATRIGGWLTSARDRNPLLLAARKLVGVAPLTPLQSNLGQQFVRAFPRLRRPARIEKRQLNIFQGAGAGKQIETLEDETDAAASNHCERGFFQQADIHSAQQVVAAGRFVETAEDIHEGGLAGARRTHDRNELALRYPKAHAVERSYFDITHMVAFVDVANLDKFRHRSLP